MDGPQGRYRVPWVMVIRNRLQPQCRAIKERNIAEFALRDLNLRERGKVRYVIYYVQDLVIRFDIIVGPIRLIVVGEGNAGDMTSIIAIPLWPSHPKKGGQLLLAT